jgi:hypothetical protein
MWLIEEGDSCMGADMTFEVLWTRNGKTYPAAAKNELKNLVSQETDPDTIKFLTWQATGNELDEKLYIDVMLCDPKLKETWAESIIEYYNNLIDEVESTLKSREVAALRIGKNILGYITGGMSWGDSPTEAFDSWFKLFREYDDDWCGNPYSEKIGKAYGLVELEERDNTVSTK